MSFLLMILLLFLLPSSSLSEFSHHCHWTPLISNDVFELKTSIIRPEILAEDDLAGEVDDEYDPMFPNNYEDIKQEEKDMEEKEREEERLLRKLDREKERASRRRHHDSDSDEEREKRKKDRKQLAAVPPPSSLTAPEPADSNPPEVDGTSSQMVYSALEQLSKIKAQKKNTLFSKPFKTSAVASNIMSKYGWKEGQGLGKTEQGISTALQVEKTGFRGGKIVDLAAEQKIIVEAEKKKAQSIAAVMKNPTKVVLLTNMVGPGEVDEDLQPEVIEECSKYGEVKKCLIFEMPPGGPDEEAVRIFVEFSKIDSAIKAVIDLNGRYFGGRIVRGSFFPEARFEKLDLVPDKDS